MSGDLHHIDDLFKSGLEGTNETPSPAVWNNIEKELDKKDSRPRIFYWWNSRKIAAGILILLGSAGLFAGGYFLRGLKMDDKMETTSPLPEPSSSLEQKKTASTTEGTGLHKSETHPLASPDPGEAGKSSSELSMSQRTLSKKAADLPSASGLISKPINPITATTDRSNPAYKSKTFPASQSNVGVKSGVSLKTSNNPAVDNNKADRQNITSLGVEQENISSITRETETISASSASRDLPVSEKKITSPFKASSPAVSIPVLKKNASVDLPRFALTPVISLQFGSNRIVANHGYHDAARVKDEIDRTESQPAKISGGILADLKIAKNMTLQSGLIYSSRQIQIDPKYIISERNADGKIRYKFECSAGTYYIKKSTYARPGDTALTVYSTNDLNYLNIPLALTYHFGEKKFQWYLTAGAGINILTKQYLETGLYNQNYDHYESITTNLKSNYYNGMIGAGIAWQPYKKISFLFSPQYQFGITPMNENMPVKAYPRIFNMQAGMRIRL